MTVNPADMYSATKPGDPERLYRELHGELRVGRFEAVRDRLLAAYPAPPRDGRFEQLLGLAHRGLLDSSEAHAAFARAIAIRPNDPLLAHSLARSALEAGWKSSRLFERAHKLSPGDGSVLLGRAAALLAEGNGKTALEELSVLLATNTGWIEGHRTYAQIAAIIEPGGNGCATLRRALEGEPRNASLWHALIQQHLGAYHYDRALAAVQEARAALGSSEGLDQFEATALGEAGDSEAALAILAKQQLPANAESAIYALRILIRCGRYSEALALAERDYPEPGIAAVWPYRALLWRLLGDARWNWLEGDERLVRAYDLPIAPKALARLAVCLRGLHQGTGAPLDQSVRGGTQTDGHLFARAEPEIRELRDMIGAAVSEYVAQLPAPDPTHPTLSGPRGPIRYAGAWSVRLRGAGYHHDHVHTHGWISSACYIALPDTSADAPEAGWLTFGENRRLLPDLDAFRMVGPVPGRLVLFPSTMWHGTRPYGQGERLTVAFDIARPVG